MTTGRTIGRCAAVAGGSARGRTRRFAGTALAQKTAGGHEALHLVAAAVTAFRRFTAEYEAFELLAAFYTLVFIYWHFKLLAVGMVNRIEAQRLYDQEKKRWLTCPNRHRFMPATADGKK
jgi:hypothetical protein